MRRKSRQSSGSRAACIAESSLKTLKKENAALVEEVSKLRKTIAAGSNAPVARRLRRERTRAAR